MGYLRRRLAKKISGIGVKLAKDYDFELAMPRHLHRYQWLMVKHRWYIFLKGWVDFPTTLDQQNPVTSDNLND